MSEFPEYAADRRHCAPDRVNISVLTDLKFEADMNGP